MAEQRGKKLERIKRHNAHRHLPSGTNSKKKLQERQQRKQTPRQAEGGRSSDTLTWKWFAARGAAFLRLFLRREWNTKEICREKFGHLTMSALKELVMAAGHNDSATSLPAPHDDDDDDDIWRLAVAMNSLVDTPMRFTEAEMEAWDEDQVDRWLSTTGFPACGLGVDGEDIVEAERKTIRMSCKKIVKQEKLDATRDDLADHIIRARNAALGRSEHHMKVGALSWDKQNILGQSNSSVFKGMYNNIKICAIKKITHIGTPAERQRCEEEVKRLVALQDIPNNLNIIQYYAHEEYADSFYLAMELADGGTLLDLIKSHGLGSWAQRKHFCRQLCRGLLTLHNKASIVHRDLKPENLLFVTTTKGRSVGGSGVPQQKRTATTLSLVRISGVQKHQGSQSKIVTSAGELEMWRPPEGPTEKYTFS